MKLREMLFFTIGGIFILCGGLSVSAHTDDWNEDLMLYCDYIEEHNISDYLCGTTSDREAEIQGFSIADFDNDGRPELLIKGQAASANRYISILDLQDNEVECVYSEWGHILGYDYFEEFDNTCMVIAFGNGNDSFFDGGIYVITPDWEKVVYASGYQDNYTEEYLDYCGKEISAKEYADIRRGMTNNCIKCEYDFDYNYSIDGIDNNMRPGDIRNQIKNYAEMAR